MSNLSQSTVPGVRLLAIDSACAACSAAVWINGTVVSSRRRKMVRGQAEALMPMVIDVMTDAKADFASLDLVAVTIGPGSFTGLRTGLATARGFALSLSLPLIGVTTTQSIAVAAHRHAPTKDLRHAITVVLNSRRADLYVQHFDAALTPIGDPHTARPEEIIGDASQSGVIFAGDATDQLLDIVQTTGRKLDFSCFPVVGPDAEFVAEIAANRWSNRVMGEMSFPNNLLYLRAPEAVKPLAGGRLRQ